MKQAMRFRFHDGPIYTVDEIKISALMPKPDDPEFDTKLDVYFRKYTQALLSAGDDELRGSLFDELKRMLEQRDDVLKAHATFTKAKGEVNRYVGTRDALASSTRPVFPATASSNGGFPKPLASRTDLYERQKDIDDFWKDPSRPSIEKSVADFWKKYSDQ